jgi:hypothetical protein
MPVIWVGMLMSAGGQPPFTSNTALTPRDRIDELVFARLKRLGIKPANLCSDAVFVRRAYLDVIGTLPTALEAGTFILDPNLNKRSALVDRLLARDEFADYWAMKWSDLLRVKAEFPINLWPNAAQAYHHWIRTCLQENVPYDHFVRELLTANGSNFAVPQVNFYRAVQGKEPRAIARAVALAFMGTRAETWPEERLSGMAAFFSSVAYKSTKEWKEEIVYFDPGKLYEPQLSPPPPAETRLSSRVALPTLAAGSPGILPRPATGGSDATTTHTLEAPVTDSPPAGDSRNTAVLPDGTPAMLSPDRDPRAVFADWLIAPGNPWFARNIVNRLWYWLLGRGVINEPDDIRPDNPPSNPELLAFLEQELISSHYDLKRVYRLILNSQTYELSCVPGTDTPEAAAHFAFYPLRRLEAEVLIDAINQVTGSTEQYSSAIPEPFTFMPEGQRSIALPDGSITSSFLELFGRPPRDTGLESERNNRVTAAQRLHLLNSSHILRKIQQSPMIQYQTQSRKTPREIAVGMYLAILSRFPTEEELKIVETYFQSSGTTRRDAVVDLAWSLINSSEFLHRH